MQAFAQITWFYYHDLQKAAHFYEEFLQFKMVEDQGMARIYKVGQASYFGMVDPTGHCRPQEKNAALLTLVVDDVSEWHAHLKAKGVQVSDILEGKKVKQHFFLQDPGGYEVEIQTFRDQHVQGMFEG